MNQPALSRKSTSASVLPQQRSKTQESPLHVPEESFWLRGNCSKLHRFTHLSAARPLGRMQCDACRGVLSSWQEVEGFKAEPIEGMLFKVSLPAGEIGPPQTLFVSVCCHCGRSHLRVPYRADELQQDKQPRHKVRRTLSNTFKHVKASVASSSRSPNANNISLPINESHVGVLRGDLRVLNGGVQERKCWTVEFEKDCKCGHTICEECLKLKVPAEGEWVSRTFDIGTAYTQA